MCGLVALADHAKNSASATSVNVTAAVDRSTIMKSKETTDRFAASLLLRVLLLTYFWLVMACLAGQVVGQHIGLSRLFSNTDL